MNDSKNNPKSFPPDDFSATTPNIKVPRQDLSDYRNEGSNDWEKTNYNYSPKDLQVDQWNKMPHNQPPQNQPNDYNQPYGQPPRSNAPKDADWGATQANIKLPSNQPNDYSQTQQVNLGGDQRQQDYGATTPLIRLPENERQKYQNLPPVAPTVAPEEEKKKGGIPGWLLVSGGLLAVFLFCVIVIAAIYFLTVTPGYDVVIRGAPQGTKIYVGGSQWQVSDDKGNYRLLGLQAGETKRITFETPKGHKCDPIDVNGNDGQEILKDAPCRSEKIEVVQNQPKPGCDPKTFTKGDIAKSHSCAYEKLGGLTEKFTPPELLEAMNLYIIQFASGKYNINPEDMKFLQKSAEYMKKLPPEIKIEVGGHTDNTGRDNQKLSENRANAVREALISFGINKDVLKMQGYADRDPVDTNATEDGKFRNRRINYRAA